MCVETKPQAAEPVTDGQSEVLKDYRHGKRQVVAHKLLVKRAVA